MILISFYDWCKNIVPNAPKGNPLTAESKNDILDFLKRSCVIGDEDDKECINFFCNVWNEYVNEVGLQDQIIYKKDISELDFAFHK